MSEVEHLQGPIPLDGFSHILAETSLKNGSTWSHQTANPFKAELCALERSRRTSADVEHRKTVTKAIWKLRRQTRRKRGHDLLDQFTRQGKTRQWKQMSGPRVLPPSLDGEEDRTAWSGLLSEHFKQVFSHSSEADEAWRVDLKHRLDEAYDEWKRSPSLSVVFTLEDVRSAVHKLKRGKTTASDQCSAEMFHALDDPILMKLAVSLSVRASGGMPTPPSWKALRAFLFAKVPNPSASSHFRPITIVPTCRKLYSAALLEKIKPFLTKNLSHWNFGCRAGFQALELIHSLRSLAEKAHEWRLPLAIAKLDFRKAYDTLLHQAIETTLRESGCGEELLLAFMREMMDLQIEFDLNGVRSSPVAILAGILQGDPASPLVFTATIDRILRPLIARWARENVGFKVDGETFFVFAWMDDSYIVSDSVLSLQTMVSQVSQSFSTVGLALQPSKCQWMANSSLDQPEASISVAGNVMHHVPGDQGFQVLGTQLTLNADPWPEWNLRMGKTWKAFWAASALLLNPRVRASRRVAVFHSCVTPVLLWALAGLACTESMLKHADIVQRAMVARIMRKRRRASELWLPWFRRTRRMADQFLYECNLLPWSVLIQKRTLTWAGHLARFGPDRICRRIYFWRNLEWWRQRQVWIKWGANELRHKGQIGFPRRWETPVETFGFWASDSSKDFRPWYILAQDRTSWSSAIHAYLGLPENF